MVMAGLKRKLARHVDETRIRSAIEDAESRTTGVIVVSLAPHLLGNIRTAAKHAFRALPVSHATHGNGVLFFIIPSRREFAVMGGPAIHAKVGQEFWDRVVAAMSERMKRGDITDGILHGIEEAGRELARHFPSSR